MMGGYWIKALSISYLALLLNVFVSLITVPLLLDYFGQDIYGVFSITSDLIYYLSLLGFGVPWVAVTIFANLKTIHGKISILMKSVILLFLISCLMLCIFITVVIFVPGWVQILGNIPPAVYTTSEKLVIIIMLSYILRLPISIFSQLLTFIGKVDVVKYIEIFNTIVMLAVIIIVKSLHLSVLNFAIYNGVISLVTNIIYLFLFIKFWKRDGCVSGSEGLKENVSYQYIIRSGWYVLITNVAGVVIWNTDNLVIGHMLDISEVAKYAILFKLFLILSNVLTQILNIVNPIYPKLYSEHKYEQMQELYAFLSKIFPILGGLAFIVIYGVSHPFIVLWTHNLFIFPGYLTAFCLACYAYFSWNSVISFGVLNSLNLNKIMYKLTTLEAILNLILSCLFVRYLGVAGVVLGTLVAHVLFEFLLIPRLLYNKFDKKFQYDFVFVFRHILFVMLPVGGVVYFINRHFSPYPYVHLAIIGVVILVYLLVSIYTLKLSYLKNMVLKLKEAQIF
jgi:O-antigen/teichoic acid export membrane protein